MISECLHNVRMGKLFLRKISNAGKIKERCIDLNTYTFKTSIANSKLGGNL